jgi:hypothetical protein
MCVVITKYHSLGVLSNKYLFLRVPEAGGSSSGCQHSLVLRRAVFLAFRQRLLTVSLHELLLFRALGEGEKGVRRVSRWKRGMGGQERGRKRASLPLTRPPILSD